MAADPTDAKKAAEILKKAMAEWSDPEVHKQLQEYEDILERFPEKADMVAKAVGRINKEQRELADSTKSLERSTERLIRSLTGVEQQADGVVAGIARMTTELEEGETRSQAFGRALKTMGKTIAKTMTPMNAGIAVFKKFAEASVVLTMEIDNASSAFAKATGTGNQYKNVIKAAEFQNRRYGVSASESAAATSTLIGGFSEFLMIDGELQKALVTEITQFEKFGVAAGTSAKFLQNVTRTTGRSIPAAQRLQKSIMGTANAFGDDLNKVMEESAEIMPQLAIHGHNLEVVFNDLYSASKRTGMGMSEIISFAEKFDTFDTAAQAAGNLNAVLGQMGGVPLVDTMQILEETNPAERMQLFSDAIQQSVGDFEELGYYQQKAIANAMGLSVEETRRIVLQEEQTNKLNAAMNKAGLAQEDINKLMADGRDLMTELKIFAMQFAVSLETPLKHLKAFIGFINEKMKGMSPMGRLVTALAGTAGTLKAIKMGAGMLGFGRGKSKSKPLYVEEVGAAKKLGFKYGQGGMIGPAEGPGGAAGQARRAAFQKQAVRNTSGVRGLAGRALLTTPAVGGMAVAAGAAGAAWAIKSVIQEKDKEKQQRKGIGMMAGGVIGGMLGSVLGPMGTVAGAGIGMKLGEFAGASLAAGGVVTKPTVALTGEKLSLIHI